ncbi:methyltransferase domain-containing protein [Brevibacterium atlanticum]|uniref:methyltransferase domain-containing protein n=1 Tax=Brevibacterium atlanticum TaxID=2697563 RepID=UPI0014246153|nr:class I SAM-dependent methyltransferase [Brevibacterium atlanticum]
MSQAVAATSFGHGGARPYERALVRGGPLLLTAAGVDETPTLMDVDRYTGPADAADLTVIARATGAVIDLGCGPGRIVRAAIAAERFALGIDISAAAVAMAQAEGLPVLCRDIGDPLPLEGQWNAALLLDGNIGIGGDPARLLERARRLIDPSGLVIVETAQEPDEHRVFLAEVRDSGGRTSAAFPWAQVGSRSLTRIAESLGLQVEESWSYGSRAFLALRSASRR